MTARVTIFTFHSVDDLGDVISYPPVLFGRLARALATGGAPVIALSDAVSGLRGEGPLPEKSVVITFDDGYRSVYERAFPVLSELGLPATVFLTAGSGVAGDRPPPMEGRMMLSWDEVREMNRGGIDFGAHTRTHADLTQLAAPEAESEMAGSKEVLEKAIGGHVLGFAFPFGRSNDDCLRLARTHFSYACTDRLGFAGPESDLHALPRVDAYYVRAAWLVDGVGASWFPWTIRARAVPRRLRRAIVGLSK